MGEQVKIEVKIEDFTKALAVVKPLAEKTKSRRLNIEAMVILSSGGTELIVGAEKAGTTALIRLDCTTSGAVNLAGKVALKSLEAALKGKKQGTMTLSVEGQNLVIQIESRSSRTKLFEADLIDLELNTHLIAILPAEEVRESLVAIASMPGEDAIGLGADENGVQLLKKGERSYHAGICQLSKTSRHNCQKILSSSSINEAKKVFSAMVGEVSLEDAGDALILRSERVLLALDCQNHDEERTYGQQIQSFRGRIEDKAAEVIVSQKSLKTALQRVSIMIQGEKEGALNMAASGDDLILSTESTLGWAKDPVRAIAVTAESFGCKIKAKTFESALSNCSGEVKLSLLHLSNGIAIEMSDGRPVSYLFSAYK